MRRLLRSAGIVFLFGTLALGADSVPNPAGVLPVGLCTADVEQGRLRRILPEVTGAVTIGLSFPNRADMSKRVRAFADHWATIATLIETCKLNDIDPLSYLTDVLARIVNGHPNRDIDALLPWAYRKQDLRAVA